MILMLSIYCHQNTKTATNKQIVKKILQTCVKASVIILRTKGSDVATLNVIASIVFSLSPSFNAGLSNW